MPKCRRGRTTSISKRFLATEAIEATVVTEGTLGIERSLEKGIQRAMAITKNVVTAMKRSGEQTAHTRTQEQAGLCRESGTSTRQTVSASFRGRRRKTSRRGWSPPGGQGRTRLRGCMYDD